MPSEKEILDFIDPARPSSMADYGKLATYAGMLRDAYLSMKSERDKYKAIVEADTDALEHARIVISTEDDVERDLGCNDAEQRKFYNDALDSIDAALALREKES